MCGIAGFAGFRNDELLMSMCRTIRHRGPDDNGFFYSDCHSIGMQRLSIIDIEGGHQPMTACNGKVAIVFNGEIYNYKELRAELEKDGHRFRTHSDTEVILLGFVERGLRIIDSLIGMFAIAISDRRDRPVLYIIRDRFGVKPIYYYANSSRLMFASEMKALMVDADLPRKINPLAVDHYLKFRYVPGDKTLFQGVYKLPPGSMLKFGDGGTSIERYWSPAFPTTKKEIAFDDAVVQLQQHMETSVKRRLVADVPVGAFLSGGIDSTIMVALMAKFHAGPVNTFTIGFNSDCDETAAAAEAARIIGTNHQEIVCSDRDFENLDSIIWHLDEPIGDAIVLPTYLLAKNARRQVKVVLSGEGADEVFGGYLFDKTLLAVVKYRKYVPKPARLLGQYVFAALPHQIINTAFEYPADLGNEGKTRLAAFLRSIENSSVSTMFRHLITLFPGEALKQYYSGDFMAELEKSSEQCLDIYPEPSLDDILSLRFRDWLCDLIMMRYDKMTMAHSLEGREPYLDHEMFNFVCSLPDKYKIKGWREKVVLRRLGLKILPDHLISRKKKPFYIPLDEYFGRPTFLKLFESFKSENYLGSVFSRKYLRSLNLSDRGMLKSKQLFSLIALNTWFKLFMKGAGSSHACIS